MKKAEIIKNGNVNLEPIEINPDGYVLPQNNESIKQIDWDEILKEYRIWYLTEWNQNMNELHPLDCLNWLKKRLK